MVIAGLFIFGACLGSFVNALVWRVHEQEKESHKDKPDRGYLKLLSVTKGRSLCPNCKHELAKKDLIPVLSWLSLKGRCRYCHKPISKQYPIVELSTALLYVASYIWWPYAIVGLQIAAFATWLLLATGLMALLVYDLKWMLLPDRIIYPLSLIAIIFAVFNFTDAINPARSILSCILSIIIGGGIFYVIYQVSNGKWIGGGDVKLGWLLGLVVGSPTKSVLMIFLASVIGSLVSIPLLLTNRMKRTSMIPFGPFLIIGAIITVLFGSNILDWYTQTFINL